MDEIQVVAIIGLGLMNLIIFWSIGYNILKIKQKISGKMEKDYEDPK